MRDSLGQAFMAARGGFQLYRVLFAPFLLSAICWVSERLPLYEGTAYVFGCIGLFVLFEFLY